MNELITQVNNFLWDYILIITLIGAGIYFTIKTRFVQFRMIGEMFRLLGDGVTKVSKNINKENTKQSSKGISSFAAFCIGLASRVGTGNLAGVATALAIGGPGAIFWMWLLALLGGASSFVENTLAQLYKQIDKKDEGEGSVQYVGGPAYYMLYGLKKKWMGILFAIIISLTFGLFFNSVQSNTIALSLKSIFGINTSIVGFILAFFTLIIIFGGAKRIARFSSIVVPFMALTYIITAIIIVLTHFHQAEYVFTLIFKNAFGGMQVTGGLIGVTISQGIKRGLFSNEAGMGSAPNAAASANVSHPVKQGLIQTLGVFVDTLIICTCTAFIILVSGVSLDGSIKGIELTQSAMDNMLGPGIGSSFIAFIIFFFAFSSIIGNYYYSEANIKFISQKKSNLYIYRVAVGLIVFAGSIASLDLVWNMADIFMAIMAFTNIVAIIILGKLAFNLLKDYTDQRKAGIKSPVYKNDEFDAWR